jgi:hypothetical protein
LEEPTGKLNPDRVDALTEPRCRCCRSRKRDELDRGLRAGRSTREIAKQFGFTKSGVARHAAHVDAEIVDARAEAEKAAALLDAFLAAPMNDGQAVLDRGKMLTDAQVRIARSILPENARAASAIVARAQAALVELHARAFKLIGTDAQPPALVDNSVKIVAILERMDSPALRELANGGSRLALTADNG